MGSSVGNSSEEVDKEGSAWNDIVVFALFPLLKSGLFFFIWILDAEFVFLFICNHFPLL